MASLSPSASPNEITHTAAALTRRVSLLRKHSASGFSWANLWADPAMNRLLCRARARILRSGSAALQFLRLLRSSRRSVRQIPALNTTCSGWAGAKRRTGSQADRSKSGTRLGRGFCGFAVRLDSARRCHPPDRLERHDDGIRLVVLRRAGDGVDPHSNEPASDNITGEADGAGRRNLFYQRDDFRLVAFLGETDGDVGAALGHNGAGRDACGRNLEAGDGGLGS